MIAFIVGTTAELIKIAPVHHELAARGRASEIWYAGQHVGALAPTLRDLGLPRPAQWLVPAETARDVARPADVPGWAARIAATVLRRSGDLRRRLGSDGTPPVVLVHGDTFTAPIGALIGRLLGARVGHVEAGLRSGSLLHPFPEELNRRVVGRLADVHFPPTPVEAHHLRHHRGAVVTTGANTVVDAVRYALEAAPAPGTALPEEYGLATLHRFELVRKADLYRRSLETLRAHTDRLPIVYFVGASERERLRELDLLGLFDESRFLLRPKVGYVQFLPVLARARFVVTDSGGLQEECAHLGIPCAVHRARTERLSGAGTNMVITEFSMERLTAFLDDVERYRTGADTGAFRPSATIVDALELLAR